LTKKLVIVGATGMVGGYALRYALDEPDVGTVTVPEPTEAAMLPGQSELLRLQSGIVKGRDDDEPVAVPLRGLAEFDVERFAGRSDRFAVRQYHLSAERPGGACDHGDPIATAKLDRIRDRKISTLTW